MGQFNTKKSTASVSQSVSYADRIAHLIAGYLPKSMRQYQIVSISKIISTYLIFLKFDVYPLECNNLIKDNGYKIYRSAISHKYDNPFMIGCSYGFPDKGIHNIKIQILHDANRYDSIGVVTNLKDCTKFKEYFSAVGWCCQYKCGVNSNDPYGIRNATIELSKNSRTGSSSWGHTLWNHEQYIWKRNDIITIYLDMNRRILRFYNNDTLVINNKLLTKGEIFIPTNETCYVVVRMAATCEEDATYIIVDSSENISSV
eukprot:254230_1